MNVDDAQEASGANQPRPRLVLCEAASYFEFPVVLLESRADEYFGRINRTHDARQSSTTVPELLAKLNSDDREHVLRLAAMYDEDLDENTLGWDTLLTIIYGSDEPETDENELDDDWEGSPPSIVAPPLGRSLEDLLSLDDELWEDAGFLESINFWTSDDPGAYVIDPDGLQRALAQFGYELIERRDRIGEP